MEEIGVISSIEGIIAKVRVPKKSVCEGCTAGTCKPADQSMEIEALNPVRAIVGQKVRIVMRPYTYLKGSLIVYGLPAFALIAGAVLGKDIVSDYIQNIDQDIVSAIVGFGAFAISFIAIKLWSKKLEKKVEYKPVIEEIIKD